MKQPFTRTVTKNGAQLYVIATHDSPVVHVKITFPCGFLMFGKQDHHVPHLLEHLLLSESETFNSDRALNQHLRRLGAAANAATSPEELYVTLRAPLNGLVPAFEAILHSIFQASLTPAAVEREKDVIIREIYERFDGISDSVQAETMAKIMPEHYMATADEHIESVHKIEPEQLAAAYKQYIVPSNSKVMVSGSLSAKQQKDLAKTLDMFSGTVSGPLQPLPELDLQSVLLAESYSGLNDNGYVTFSFVEKTDPSEPAASKIAKNLMDSYLFSSPSAVIPAELRARGLIYSWDSNLMRAGNMSIYTISLTATPENLPSVIAVIIRHLSNVANGDIALEDVEDIRLFVRYMLPTLLETTAEYLDWYDVEIRDGRTPRTIESELKIMESITATQIEQAAKEVFWSGDVYAFAMGNNGTAEWSVQFQELVEVVRHDGLDTEAMHDVLDDFVAEAAAAEAMAPAASDHSELYWFVYGCLVFVSLVVALRVQYLPLVGNGSATVSMFDQMYDKGHWLWGGLLFLPAFIGCAIVFNFSRFFKKPHLILTTLTSISAGAYVYGVVTYFGDMGKDNVPFFWQDFASILHPVTFLLLTPFALYIAVRGAWREYKIRANLKRTNET